jgi:hypothetical protein
LIIRLTAAPEIVGGLTFPQLAQAASASPSTAVPQLTQNMFASLSCGRRTGLLRDRHDKACFESYGWMHHAKPVLAPQNATDASHTGSPGDAQVSADGVRSKSGRYGYGQDDQFSTAR